jgi:general stress protein CsbA
MSFSYSAVWDETARTLRAHSTLLIAVAGVFLFLPQLIASYVAPPPQEQGVAAITAHYSENFWIIFIAQLIAFVGNLVLLTLVLDERHPTVAGSIRAALAMLPAYLLVTILSAAMLFAGVVLATLPLYLLAPILPRIMLIMAFFLLVLPLFHLMGRLAAAGPVLVAEGRRNPFDIIRRSFEISRRNGWAIVGLILLVGIAFLILMLAVTLVFGSIQLIVDRSTGGSVGAFLLLILNSAVGAIFNIVLMVLFASIYRRLTNGGQPAAAPSSGI